LLGAQASPPAWPKSETFRRYHLLRLSFDEIYETLQRVLTGVGFSNERAELCARLFAETSLDGVYSHGLNRFPRFIEAITSNIVNVDAEPKLVQSFGALQRWDGMSGPGNLNAWVSMDRAISLAKTHGIGCVALRNTNHWMRGGTYGWQAADAGFIGICWTNTLPNLPPWGGTKPTIGNNPLVIAVPRDGGHVVLDMAMSQFSFGALESYRKRGDHLPVIGGFDREGELTRDPVEIEASGRPLPIGYWKGSGLSLMLDAVAALLSDGNATNQIPGEVVKETRLSQVFIALASHETDSEQTVNGILEFMKSSAADGSRVRYPGEQTLETRKLNQRDGIPVDDDVWDEILRLDVR
jgi:3-dehydro-L-gulonate 2-dehydrogenase